MKLSVATIFALTSGALSASAADLGVDFKAMPAGCQWHVEWSDGAHWIETFLGKKGKFYTVKTVLESNPDVLVRNSYYTTDGHIVRGDYANGSWQSLEPHSCFTVLGACEYRFRTNDGTDWQIKSKVKKLGKNKYRSESYVVGGRQHWEETFTLGPFKLEMLNKAGSEFTKVTKIENCGDANS